MLRLFQALKHLRTGVADPANANVTVFFALIAYVAVWTAYGVITKGPAGFHPDMTEIIAWSRDLDFGYVKHPPLAAWLVAGWFEMFPVANWSYYLLAMLMPAIALWVIWLISADYMPMEKRVAGLALMTLIPFFSFHALKFNVNTVLMPLWALTTLFFLRSYKTHRPRAAALAGIFAAASMLGKYWSVFLIAGLVVAALGDRRRNAYFRSAAPWVTVIIGAILLASHIIWLIGHDFVTFGYAAAAHETRSFLDTVIAAFGYLAGSFGYVALPTIIVVVVARAHLTTLREMAWPQESYKDDDRRLVALAFWAPLLLPIAGSLVAGIGITSLWSMSAWTLLPIMLLSPKEVTWRPSDTKRVVVLAAVLPIILLIAAPFIVAQSRPKGPPSAAAQAPLLAREVDRLWRQIVPSPLRYIGGDGDIVLPVTAYAADRPSALLPGFMISDPVAVRRAGMVLICFAGDEACLARAKADIGNAPFQTNQTTVVRTPGNPGAEPRRYTVLVVTPPP